MEAKVALITGITGQDGSYLAEFLLAKGYEVHGIKRRSSSLNTERIDHIYQDPHVQNRSLQLHYGDLTDTAGLIRILGDIRPDEIYNLGAQSHVAVSFEVPEYTSDVNALGALRLLEALRIVGLAKKTRFYQASSSELFGLVRQSPQNEATPFYPRSPYAVAKLYAYWITVNYRQAYDIFACNGILFNHESSRRGETFVTRKITRGLTHVLLGLEQCVYLGNLGARRDWGHAKDFVEMQWLMLQQDSPDDYVIATGQQATVRDFVGLVCSFLGVGIRWEGNGENEVAIVTDLPAEKLSRLKKGDVIVRVDPRYFRPSEVDTLLGDASKAREKLGWEPQLSLGDMVEEMVKHDLEAVKKKLILKNAGFTKI